MTVAELIAHLQTFPPNALVVCSRYSDVQRFEVDEVTAERVIVKHGNLSDPDRWKVKRWHTLLRPQDEATMDPALKPYVQTVVHFAGN